MIHYTACPLCKASHIQQKFAVKDYTVSGENFDIYTCQSCTGAFTQDVPTQEAIGKYYAATSYVSHSETKDGLVNKLYHAVRTRTLREKKKMIQQLTGRDKGSLLDVGCGTGAFVATMLQAGWDATGLEPDETARKNAQQLYQVQPLPAPEIFNLPAQQYDAITMWHVLEHVHQLHEYIDQLKKLLKPSGKILIAVPNYTSEDAQHYKTHWAAYDVPRHLYHFSPESMKTLMELHGMQVLQYKPMWFDSFYVSMLSEQYKNGKGNLVAAFSHGLASNLSAMGKPEKCSSVIYIIGK
jgi:2-polyprenyl-3-methyl-5-hydroxy-6-metoxy-1,4-benzoquinol methylase